MAELFSNRLFRVLSVPDAAPLSPGDSDFLQAPLVKHLFSEDVSTYAVLDAAVVPNLVEMLETSSLENRCLFTGESEDEYGAIAPWLVHLDANSVFAQNLLTDSKNPAPWHLWGYEPGVFIQSKLDFSALWSHLRKFTRIRDETDNWYYFRFWDTDSLFLLMRHPLADQLPVLRSLLHPEVTTSIIGHNVFDQVLAAEVTISAEEAPVRPAPSIQRSVFDALGPELSNRRSARNFARDYPAVLNSVPMTEIRTRIHHARATAAGFKVDGENLVGTFILLGVVYAPRFWEEEGFIMYWNNSSLAPNARFKAYLDALKSQLASQVPDFKAWW